MSIAPITVDPIRQPTETAAATPAAATAASGAPAAANDDSDGGGISFGDILDVVNPLQHLPVIGTLYRELTGDQIKPFPKAAGDLLYGGPLGFVGSIADTLFEKITGKDFGSTVYDTVKEAFFGGSDDTKAVASNASAAPAPASVTAASLDTIAVPGQDALLSALSAHGVNPDIALRASDAYRRAVNVTPANDPVPSPALRATIVQ
jgi:hypothetical protein